MLALLTPVFQHMPLNALAAIVITGVLGLLDFPRCVQLFRVRFPCSSCRHPSPLAFLLVLNLRPHRALAKLSCLQVASGRLQAVSRCSPEGFTCWWRVCRGEEPP